MDQEVRHVSEVVVTIINQELTGLYLSLVDVELRVTKKKTQFWEAQEENLEI